jgi:hypothetical protein
MRERVRYRFSILSRTKRRKGGERKRKNEKKILSMVYKKDLARQQDKIQEPAAGLPKTGVRRTNVRGSK